MKILCVCPIGIGNYLLMYPACYALKARRPQARLHLLALRHAIRDLAEGDPLWEGIHCIDPTSETSLMRQGGFVSRLWRERFDVSLCFFPSNTWQYNLLPYITGVPERFGFSYPLKKGASLSFLNTRLVPIDPEAHDIIQNLRLVAEVTGGALDRDEIVFPALIHEQDRAFAGEFLRGCGGPQVFVGIHPGSSGEHGMASKRWDPMRFGELGDRICAALGAQALVFGGKDEAKIKHVTAAVMKTPCRIVEPCALRKTAALLEQCALLVCNDSGLMHLAASVGTPVAAVFGPTDEKRNGPWGAGHCVIRKPMSGFPLWTAATVGVRAVPAGMDPMASLRALTVEDAWAQVEPWLKRLRHGPIASGI